MSGDVTIPREMAKAIADYLRTRNLLRLDLAEAIDLLDPPPPSLREQVADIIRTRSGNTLPGKVIADEVIALMTQHYRERVAGLVFWYVQGRPVTDRRDVLALFGDGDE